MKRLYVLRHAKSSWDDSSLADFDRPLNTRGLETAPMMGDLMKQRQLLPDAVISSPAIRARETAKLTADAMGFDRPIVFDDRVYEAGPLTLLNVLSEVRETAGSVMLVGHNPGMEGLIRSLTGEIAAMPTAALAIIDLEIADWNDVRSNSGKLVDILRPKDDLSDLTSR